MEGIQAREKQLFRAGFVTTYTFNLGKHTYDYQRPSFSAILQQGPETTARERIRELLLL